MYHPVFYLKHTRVMFVLHRKHFTSLLRAKQVNEIYRFFDNGIFIYLSQFWTLATMLHFNLKHSILETEFPPRLQVDPTHLGPIEWASLFVLTPARTQTEATGPNWVGSKTSCFKQNKGWGIIYILFHLTHFKIRRVIRIISVIRKWQREVL
jgi:hypothetical protein